MPASVGVSTAQPRLAVCVAPRPCTYALRSRISPCMSPTSSSVTTIAIAIAVLTAASVGERARRAPISIKTSTTKLHVRFVRMCGGGSVPDRVYSTSVVEEGGGGVLGEWCRLRSEQGVASLRGRAREC